MSTVIKTIKDFFGNITYPITKTNAVYDSNNNRLDNILTSKQDASSNFVYKGTGSATPSIDDPELRQSDISTTQSTSDTTVPSSSLVKTMNDNLGNPSSASAVTGADAFSKISKLNSDLAKQHKSTLFMISNVTVAAGPQRMAVPMPADVIHKRVDGIMFACRYDNVYFNWTPQVENTPYMDSQDRCWQVSANNLRGSAQSIDALNALVFYED